MRECGACTVCCVHPEIAELGKGKLEHCPNLILADPPSEGVLQYSNDCGHACRVYDERPAPCAGYRCLWLDGAGLESDQPHLLGLLFDRQSGIPGSIECKPLWPGAADTSKGKKAIRRFIEATDLVALVADTGMTKIERVVK